MKELQGLSLDIELLKPEVPEEEQEKKVVEPGNMDVKEVTVQ